MVLSVLRDKYAENLRAAEAKGMARGEERSLASAKQWHERKQRAQQNGEPFNEPPPWEK